MIMILRFQWTVDSLPRVGIFALKDISVGEEITVDYDFRE